MASRKVLLVSVAAIVVLAGGCASTGDFSKLSKRVDAIEAEQGMQSSEMTKYGNSLRAVESRVDAKVAGADERLAAMDAFVKKLEAALAESSKQSAALAEDLKKLDGRFAEVTTSVTEARKMLVANLKNARDIHGAQFRALSEILETMDTGGEDAPPKN